MKVTAKHIATAGNQGYTADVTTHTTFGMLHKPFERVEVVKVKFEKGYRDTFNYHQISEEEARTLIEKGEEVLDGIGRRIIKGHKGKDGSVQTSGPTTVRSTMWGY